MKDKKALAALLVKKIKPIGADQDLEEQEDGNEGKIAAAEEFLAALKEGDAERLVYAFEDLKAMCD